jgi:hypothetical protein
MWYLVWGIGMAALVAFVVFRAKRAEVRGVFKSADEADRP